MSFRVRNYNSLTPKTQPKTEPKTEQEECLPKSIRDRFTVGDTTVIYDHKSRLWRIKQSS